MSKSVIEGERFFSVKEQKYRFGNLWIECPHCNKKHRYTDKKTPVAEYVRTTNVTNGGLHYDKPLFNKECPHCYEYFGFEIIYET